MLVYQRVDHPAKFLAPVADVVQIPRGDLEQQPEGAHAILESWVNLKR